MDTSRLTELTPYNSRIAAALDQWQSGYYRDQTFLTDEIRDVPLLSPRDQLIFGAFSLSLLTGSIAYTGYAVFSQHFDFGTTFRILFLGYFVIRKGLGAVDKWWLTLNGAKKPLFIPAPAPGRRRVVMVTTFVPGKEPLSMLENTLRGMIEVDYPHDSYVLDDGDSSDVKALVHRLNGEYHSAGRPMFYYSRPDKSAKEKGANITAWLQDVGYAHYDIATFFDSDFRPHSDYLQRVLGYFERTRNGRKIAFVQTPAPYGNRAGKGGNLISEGAEQSRQYNFGLALPSFYGHDTPLIMGDHTTIDLHALEEIGGYQVHQSDDLLTAKKLVAKGYAGLYLPDEVLAHGIGPVTWREHFIQQTKWAYGTIDLQIRHFSEPLTGLKFKQHLIWFRNSLGYLFMIEGVASMLLILGFLTLAPGTIHLDRTMTLLFLPLMIVSWSLNYWIQKFYPEYRYDGRRIFHFQHRWVSFAAWPYALKGVLLAVLRKPFPRVITPKDGDPTFHLRLFVPHLLFSGVILAALVFSLLSGVSGLLLIQLYGATFLFYNLFPVGHAWWTHRRARHAGKPSSFRPLLVRFGISVAVLTLLIHSIIPYRSFSPNFTPPPNDAANSALGQLEPHLASAWADFTSGRWQHARQTIDDLEKNCPSCWVQSGKIDQGLANSSNPWPQLRSGQSPAMLYGKYGVLYNTTAAEYIRFKAALETGDIIQARKSLRTLLMEFPHGQVYNPGGYLWSPVLAAVSEAPTLFRDVVRHDVPNTYVLKRGYQWLSWEASVRAVMADLMQKVVWIPGVLLSLLSLFARPVRKGLSRLVRARNSMIIFGTSLMLLWVSPAILQWIEHAALKYPIPDLFETAVATGFGAIFLLNLSLVFATGLWLFVKDDRVKPEAFTKDDVDLPVVTVQVAIRHEPFPLLRRTINNLLELEYPRDRLEIQIIDNSDKEESYREVKAYCEAHHVSFIHRDGTEGYKAGNLNVGLAQARGEFLLILDADSMVEPKTFLKILPYFKADPKLGYAQLRAHAANESLNLLTRIIGPGIRATQRVHDLLDRFGFARFDGRNGIIRTQALRDIGGWPKMVSEDFVASIQMRLLGYRGRFIHDVETTEDVPENFTEFVKQRRKWSFGTSQVVGVHAGAILRSRYLSFAEKFNLFQVMGDYTVNALAYVLAFSYFHFSATGILIIFGVHQIPLWIANWRRPLTMLWLLIPTIALMGGLMPSIFLGVLSSFLLLDHGFPITLKQVGAERVPISALLRVHKIPLLVSLAFLAILFRTIPRPMHYILSGQPAAMMMISALFVPFIANYLLPYTTSGIPPDDHPGQPSKALSQDA